MRQIRSFAKRIKVNSHAKPVKNEVKADKINKTENITDIDERKNVSSSSLEDRVSQYILRRQEVSNSYINMPVQISLNGELRSASIEELERLYNFSPNNIIGFRDFNSIDNTGLNLLETMVIELLRSSKTSTERQDHLTNIKKYVELSKSMAKALDMPLLNSDRISDRTKTHLKNHPDLSRVISIMLDDKIDPLRDQDGLRKMQKEFVILAQNGDISTIKELIQKKFCSDDISPVTATTVCVLTQAAVVENDLGHLDDIFLLMENLPLQYSEMVKSNLYDYCSRLPSEKDSVKTQLLSLVKDITEINSLKNNDFDDRVQHDIF